MHNQFPQMLYQQPGTEQLQDGTYGTKIVQDAAEFDAAVADGWHETPAQAKEARTAALAQAQADAMGAALVKATSPPTREELEQKATEMGIQFKPQTSDKKLAEAIAAELTKV